MNISYLKHGEIDLNKWDNCIHMSFNSSIYAFSWFLDLFSDDWSALVEGDYQSVMPLITKSFMGQKVVYTPPSIKELGIFSLDPIPPAKTADFLKAIPVKFSHFHIVLNKYNPLDLAGWAVCKQAVFNLDLISPYHKMAAGFSQELRTALNRSVALRYSFIKGIAPNDLVGFVKKYHLVLDEMVYENNYKILRSLMAVLLRSGTGEVVGVYNRFNDLSAAAILAWISNKIVFLFIGADPGQLEDGPHLFLIDRIIDKYSETNSILSFEFASPFMTPDVYRLFGACESVLNEITHGNIPFYLKPFLK